MKVNTEQIIILLNCSINQRKVIVYPSHPQRFLGGFKEFQDKISLQGKLICNSFSNARAQTLLTKSSGWAERRQQLKLCKTEGNQPSVEKSTNLGSVCDQLRLFPAPTSHLRHSERRPLKDSAFSARLGRLCQLPPSGSGSYPQLCPAPCRIARTASQ